MAFELRRMEFRAAGPILFFAGDADGAEQSGQWVSGRVIIDLPSGKSLALHQIAGLLKARDLLDGEIARLTHLYQEAEQSQKTEPLA
jgi:hypothetical protein